jgi:dihydroorotate dehydrogenase (NAD+) catalytic subunit
LSAIRRQRERPIPDLTARIGSVRLPNPVMLASGTAGHADELAGALDLSELGAVVAKSVSLTPRPGNPPLRIAPASGLGMINSVGLANPGIETWLARDLPALAGTGARVVASIYGADPGDFGELARRLSLHRGELVAVEVNLSCPNLGQRGLMFAQDPAAAAEVVAEVVSALGGSGLPVWAKLSPAVSDITLVASAVLSAGAEALTLVNTMPALGVDPVSRRLVLGSGRGGLSGPPLHPIALRAVHDCFRALSGVPIVGVGGVVDADSAAALMAVGAAAVQVGTATFFDPRAAARILQDLTGWLVRNGVASVADLVGSVRSP